MWVRFTSVHWHRFNRRLKTRFLPGQEKNLPTQAAQKAVDAGHAIKMRKKSKDAPLEPVHGEKG